MSMDIEIQQAHDIDEETGELGDAQASWWAEGHHEPEAFARALAEYALTEGYDSVPRIDLGEICHVWRRHRSVGLGDSWAFEDRDVAIAPDRPRGQWRPVTTYDLRAPKGGRQCAVRSCDTVASVRTPLGVRWGLNEGGLGDLHIDVPLCPEHRRQLDATGFLWRTLVVPVGATAVLPLAEASA